MVGKKDGFIEQLIQRNINVIPVHCFIHQQALCGKAIKLKQTMKIVTKIINSIRGGHNSLSYRKFKNFLEEVRWLSRGKSLKRLFALRDEVYTFLNETVKKSIDLQEKLKCKDFLASFAFLTDITEKINELNLKLQGKNHNILCDFVSNIDGFRFKLNLWFDQVKENDLAHFPACTILLKDFDSIDFSTFSENIDLLRKEFDKRFSEFKTLRPKLLFTNPFQCDIKSQPYTSFN